jgi:hypothetical protein
MQRVGQAGGHALRHLPEDVGQVFQLEWLGNDTRGAALPQRVRLVGTRVAAHETGPDSGIQFAQGVNTFQIDTGALTLYAAGPQDIGEEVSHNDARCTIPSSTSLGTAARTNANCQCARFSACFPGISRLG